MDNVKQISSKSGDGTMMDIKGALHDALQHVGEKGSFKNGKKILILALDDTEENYCISFIQAGMKMSECISLCETAKTIFLSEMNYI